MDLVLEAFDDHVGDAMYRTVPFTLPQTQPWFAARDAIARQTFSLSILTVLSGWLLYFTFTSVSYFFFYDKTLEKHPKFLRNQKRREIWLSFLAIPGETLLTVPWFLAEVRGYSRLYSSVSDHGVLYLAGSVALFLFFTDCLIYWIHRFLHYPPVYKRLHKPHHAWKVPTPFASHAFHPLDGYLQSVPYHLFVFLVPMHRILYLGLFVLVNFWTISIHDGNFVNNWRWINGAAHHSVHHLEYSYNYGQYFTFWDVIGGSFKEPDSKILEADVASKVK